VSDLSWFATGWLKDMSDSTILFPPCTGGVGPGQSETPSNPRDDRREVGVTLQLVAVTTPTASDTVSSLPASATRIPVGQAYFLELWAFQDGDNSTGFTSVYVDFAWPAAEASVANITHTSTFNLLTSGWADAGVIDELGGSALPGGQGVFPQLTRVAIVTLTADLPMLSKTFSISPSTTGVATWAHGQVPWNNVILQGVQLRQGIGADIDVNGVVNSADVDAFVEVLLGSDVSPAHISASDFNGDGEVNGGDIQGFLACYLRGGCR
jgi:hypothetical protein